MKKSIITILILALIGGSAWAFNPKEHIGYSAIKTADALIHTGAGYFYGFIAYTDGTNAVTFQIYDNTEASGAQMLPTFICQTSSTNRVCVFGVGDNPIPFDTGLYIDITSSDATPDYTILYRGQ